MTSVQIGAEGVQQNIIRNESSLKTICKLVSKSMFQILHYNLRIVARFAIMLKISLMVYW